MLNLFNNYKLFEMTPQSEYGQHEIVKVWK